MDTSLMKRKLKVEATSWATKMYNSLLTSILKVLKEKGEKDGVGKQKSVLASLDFESRIAMHFPFL